MAKFVKKLEKAISILIILAVFLLSWIFIQVQQNEVEYRYSGVGRRQLQPGPIWHRHTLPTYRTRISESLKSNFSQNNSEPLNVTTNRIGIKYLSSNISISRPTLKQTLTLNKSKSACNNASSNPHDPRMDTCRNNKPNFVFVKTHKTGSTTLSHILNQFGYSKRMSFIINSKNFPTGNINFVKDLTKETMQSMIYPPIRVKTGDWNRYQFQASTVHMVYNRDLINQFIPENKTRYITLLRNPVDQFMSSFRYFQNSAKFLWVDDKNSRKLLPTNEAIERFLGSTGLQNKTGKDYSQGIHGWNFFHNSQIFDLGLDHQYHNDERKVNETIKILDSEFDLVLINEYFDESLLLLRKLLCLDWKDIIYISKNLSPGRKTHLPEKINQKLLLWNHADVLLYQNFKSKFLKLLDDYGPTRLKKDKIYFEKLQNDSQNECISKKRILRGRVPHVEYSLKNNASKKCQALGQRSDSLIRLIFSRQRPKKKKKKIIIMKKKPRLVINK